MTAMDVRLSHNLAIEDVEKERTATVDKNASYCKICGIAFHGHGVLFRHLLKIHKIDGNTHFCKLCDARFISRRSLARHSTRYHRNNVGDAKVAIQKQISPIHLDEGDHSDLNETNEVLATKTVEKKMHTCFCGSKFPVPAKLKWHIQTVHEGLRPFGCELCNETFKNKITLTKHEKLIHGLEILIPKKEKTQSKNLCDICGREFRQLVHLKEHVTSVHEKNKSFACDKCEKKFHTKRKLKVHQRYEHENIRPHKCEQCDKTFISRALLVNHTDSAHEKVRSHSCAYCTKSYSIKSYLLRHIRLKHPNNPKISTK